jgi:hypothetical protein
MAIAPKETARGETGHWPASCVRESGPQLTKQPCGVAFFILQMSFIKLFYGANLEIKNPCDVSAKDIRAHIAGVLRHKCLFVT